MALSLLEAEMMEGYTYLNNSLTFGERKKGEPMQNKDPA